MKTRVLLTMLIIFIVLSGIWITCGTVFVIREIEVVDIKAQTAEKLSETEINQIVEQSNLRGKNILFSIHQDQIAEKVKSVDSMFKLQSVTTKFPNRVILRVSRRVPIYYDSVSNLSFDSDMCVVTDNNPSARVNITGVGLNDLADNLKVGDLAASKKNTRTQRKIEQLRLIGSYFNSVNGFEIAYNDDPSETGHNRLCLSLTIKPNVVFIIRLKPNEDFLRALDFTNYIYRQKENQSNGEYHTYYDENTHKVYTALYEVGGSTTKKDGNGKDIKYYEK